MKTYDRARTGASLRARQLRGDATDAEKLLWRALREKLGAFKWRRQMPIGPYFADFACYAERVVIELDGGQHSPEVDAVRTRFIEAQGYRLLRFWNNDVMGNAEAVLDTTAAALSPSPSQPMAGPLPLPVGEGKIGV
ncbi:endonuclease domain-containing protein [Sphingomonas sp.]|uniref:endonuclease domain-containing protein n=1 Tax=Sphingomonas sp. TaxID=28214 RepID=UPI0025E7ECE0|nr:DUF559 domain-containing protein [Sphingomonas sp.]